MENLRPGNQLFQRTEETSSGEIVARIQELKGRQDRIREQLNKANKVLLEAKESRDTLLLAMYAVDHQIDLLEQGQLPMFGDGIDDE